MGLAKKMKLALCLSVALVFTIASSSMADDCTSAEIMKVGAGAGMGGGTASDNVIGVKCISDTSWGTYAQFYPNTAIGDQALATALTAYSLDKKVWIRVSSKVSGSMLNNIYINK